MKQQIAIERETLSVADIAPRLGVTSGRVYQILGTPDLPLPVLRIGRSIRVSKTAWDQWLNGKKEAQDATK